MLIQKLRLQRGWSQQQLADMSGLSVRTIQRLEAGQPASPESLKSLAAVFEIDFQQLAKEPDMTTTTALLASNEEELAFQYVRKLKGFYRHLLQYVIVCSVLALVYLFSSRHGGWIFWVVGGWGSGVAAHALAVFSPWRLFSPAWEKRQVEKRLGRPL